MVRDLAKAVVINVGANKNPRYGGFRAPIFPDGSFEFMHVPWQQEYGEEPSDHKYRNYRYCEQSVPQALWDKSYIESPNFRIHAYAGTRGADAVNSYIWRLDPNDFLMFYATLAFQDVEGKKPENWINQNWGAYIIGYFCVDLICKRSEALSEQKCRQVFEEYDFFKAALKRQDKSNGTPWVKGKRNESGLLEKAIPLSRPEKENSQKWSDLAHELLRSATGKILGENAVFQAVLACEGGSLERLLSKCVLRTNDC